MMRWIVGSSLKFRFIVIAVAAALMYFGIARLQRNAGRRVPGIRAAAGGDSDAVVWVLSAEEVEELVTIPLEQALNGVPGLDVMRSKSVSRFVGRQDDLQARDRSA